MFEKKLEWGKLNFQVFLLRYDIGARPLDLL